MHVAQPDVSAEVANYPLMPYFNLKEQYQLQQTISNSIQEELIESASDVSEGRLFVTLVESSIPWGLRHEIQTDASIHKDAYLFGALSWVVVSIRVEQDAAAFNYFR